MKRIFVVLGMHRGGTSAIARGLVALGVPFGDALMPPESDNPTGFWEDREIVQLNDRILAALGLNWHSLAPIPSNAFSNSALDSLKSEGMELLAARLQNAQLWGFKDPRTSRLIGYWRTILENMRLSMVPVIAVRNPLSVAPSLEHRNRLQLEKSYLLWGLHMAPLLPLAQQAALVVDYDMLLAAPEAELKRIAQGLDLPEPPAEAVHAYAGGFLDLRLRRSHFTVRELRQEPRMVGEVADIYELFAQCARGSRIAADDVRHALARFDALSPLLRYAQVLENAVAMQANRVSGLEREVACSRDQLKQEGAELETSTVAPPADAMLHLSTLQASMDTRLNELGETLTMVKDQADQDGNRVFMLIERIAALAHELEALRAQTDCHDSEILGLLNARSLLLGRTANGLVWGTRSGARKLTRISQLSARFFRTTREQGFTTAMRTAIAFIRTRAGRWGSTRRSKQLPERIHHICPPASVAETRARGPLISILTPVFNTSTDILEATIQSVLQQTYPNWELCICDDSSSDPSTLAILERYRGSDWRIKIVRSDDHLHIARATNLAAEQATGEFVAFLDHDDVLEPDALECIAQVIRNHREVDFIYTDEDKLESDGRLTEPTLKPDWSPELLLSVMYVLHFMAVRKQLFFQLGGLRHEFSGSQDYDLALRATAQARKIVHIPKILYHWRKTPGSAAAAIDAKPQALRNATLALEHFVRSNAPHASVESGLLPGTHRVRWPLQDAGPVTLAVLTGARHRDVPGRGNLLLVENFIDSIISKSSYPHYRLLVIDDDDNLPTGVRQKVEETGGRVVSFPMQGKAFNFSKKVNFTFQQVQTENVILLNDDLEVISKDWIEALLEFSTRADIGAVGARLLFPDGSIQHAGVVLGLNGPAGHVYQNLAGERVGYCGYTHLVRNYSAVTAAVLATRMSVVRKIGPLDESLAIDFSDIDFCLRLCAAGYRVVYTPYAQLYHFESSSILRKVQSPREKALFIGRWRPLIACDPYYSPQLSKNCYEPIAA